LDARLVLDTAQLASILPHTVQIDADDISVGGCSVTRLAHEYGTPIYVYDEETLIQSAESVAISFAALNGRVSFACKACALSGVLKVFNRAGLGLDIVSGGELVAGFRADFPPDRIHMHGNFKTRDELRVAVRSGIRAIVVDNVQEICDLEHICAEERAQARVMLRLALPLEAETHPALMTAGRFSKFGLSEEEEQTALTRVQGHTRIRLIGIHVHLGSQIADADIYRRAAAQLAERVDRLRHAGFAVEEVSIGGGWAVPYRAGDARLDPRTVAQAVKPVFRCYPDIAVAVEPGRALVARSAIAVYTVGSVKRSPSGRLISVDGGMGDNPRPALYGAGYTALAVRGAMNAAEGPADVVGRYCEAGDVLARDVALPSVESGDLIAIPVSGAYQMSMVSAYNLVPAPAAVMVKDGAAQLLSRRGTIEDMLVREPAKDRA
jgi:diaminopimelate decarboxylase